MALGDVEEAKIVAVGSRSKESSLKFGNGILGLDESNCFGSYEELAKVRGNSYISFINRPNLHTITRLQI